MNTAIYRTEDPTLETVEFGALYQICAPNTVDPWILRKPSDDCGVSSIEPLEVPDGWDGSHEYSGGLSSYSVPSRLSCYGRLPRHHPRGGRFRPCRRRGRDHWLACFAVPLHPALLTRLS